MSLPAIDLESSSKKQLVQYCIENQIVIATYWTKKQIGHCIKEAIHTQGHFDKIINSNRK